MAMIKAIPPDSQDFDDERVSIIKMSNRGLIGFDKSAFVKRASHKFVDFLKTAKLHPGEIPVHLLAINATEKHSANRNGDGFRVESCRKDHPTFVKYGMLYRSHLNKDPKKSYGRILCSDFNEPMQRIELLVGMNGTKEAAVKNGGLLADKERDILERGESFPVSMSTRVPFDKCSSCGNRAKTKKDYCTEAMCKHGGLKHNIGHVFEDGHILHADNPINNFFDISHVRRPADRSAYSFGVLEKAAAAYADGKTVSGVDLAEQLGLEWPAHLAAISGEKLAADSRVELARRLSREPDPAALADRIDADVRWPERIPKTQEKIAQALRALADQGVLLPISAFLSLFSNQPITKTAGIAAEVQSRLPAAMMRLSLSTEEIAGSPYTPAARDQEFSSWAAKIAGSRLDNSRQLWAAAIANYGVEKSASVLTAADHSAADAIATHYGLYLLDTISNFSG